MSKKLLVACEESQIVTSAFLDRGIDAYSCDIKKTSGRYPDRHFQCDVFELLDNYHFDMIIAHPPCTYLTNAGSNRLFLKPTKDNIAVIDYERMIKGIRAAQFFMRFYNMDDVRICIENPIPMRIFGLPGYSQIIHPWQFGDDWEKTTCLWLKGLPMLFSTDLNYNNNSWVFHSRDPSIRSKFFPGIAAAMADQWSNYLL